MAKRGEVREGEELADIELSADACLTFIGIIRTPFATREDCPRQGKLDGPECEIIVDPQWRRGLEGLARYEKIEVLYWLHQSRRDFLIQRPKTGGTKYGTFALRSPNRPNPIGTSLVRLVRIENNRLVVRGLDCIDGTPLLDIKPDRCAFTPKAPEKAADK